MQDPSLNRRPMQCPNFYPSDPAKHLAKFQAKKMELSPDGLQKESKKGSAFAAVLPHAGWSYSGLLAFRTWAKLLQESSATTFLILSSIHVRGVKKPSLMSAGNWETPIGDVMIDEELARTLLLRSPEHMDCLIDNARAHDGDHAIEVQLPILRFLKEDAKIIPIACPSGKSARELGSLLSKSIDTEKHALVCSTDLTHYGNAFSFAPAGDGEAAYQWMLQNDKQVMDAINAFSVEQVVSHIQQNRSACGLGALQALLTYSQSISPKYSSVIGYTNSAEVQNPTHPGLNFKHGVGYFGACFMQNN